MSSRRNASLKAFLGSGIIAVLLFDAEMAAAALVRGADWRATGVTSNVGSTKCFP